ncbi:unnamed protein product [Cyclocybe aegerita]|uniref:Wax synthase domain-containing protein n=1 Tax=Cyclocybe aegerita TaxID=1973307 RepID=A0A8S0VXF4_CYCAE|nr:unnamed protein product [Cyclocybe aegerita]
MYVLYIQTAALILESIFCSSRACSAFIPNHVDRFNVSSCFPSNRKVWRLRPAQLHRISDAAMDATKGKFDFSWILFLLAHTIYLLGVSVKPSPYRWLLFIPFGSICTYLTYYTSLRDPVGDYGMGAYLMTQFFTALDFLILTDVQKELKLVGQKDGVADKPLKTRLVWGLKLLGSPRGIGWTYAPTSILPTPSKPSTTRRQFIVSRLSELAANVLLYDLNGFVIRANPCMKVDGPSFWHTGNGWMWMWRAAGLSYTVAAWININVLHILYSLLSVGLGSTEPQEWTPLFGRLWDAHTVRRFWGRVWHQMMRRLLSKNVDLVSKTLGLPRRNRITEFFCLFLAFFISAVIHGAGDAMMLTNWRQGGSFLFFALQPFAIALEEMVMSLGRRMSISGNSTTVKMLGLLWAFLWFSNTLPIVIDIKARRGFFQAGPQGSVFLSLVRGEWTPK